MPVNEAHKTYLGFQWQFPEGTRYYVFNVLDLGSNKAVAFFHELLILILAYCRLHGLPVVGYIDAFQTHDRSKQKCERNLNFLK